MKLQKVLGSLRLFFEKRNYYEVPAYPDFRIFPWMHPDIVFNGFALSSCNLFVFQPFLNNAYLENRNSYISGYPQLVWMRKPFVRESYAAISEFFNEFLTDFVSGFEPSDCKEKITENLGNIHLVGSQVQKNFFEPQGCAWDIYLNFQPLGKMMLLTDLLQTRFNVPVLIGILNLSDLFDIVGNILGLSNCCETQNVIESKHFLAWRPRAGRALACRISCNFESCINQILEITEEFLAKKDWFEAFRSILEGYAFIQNPLSEFSNNLLVLDKFEQTFKPFLKKIMTLFYAYIKETKK